MTTETSESSNIDDIKKYNVEQFCEYLAMKFDKDMVESFRFNKISGSVFLQLSEEQIGKMFKAIGDVVQLLNLKTEFLVRANIYIAVY